MHEQPLADSWIERVKAGDEEAARQLWDRYFPQLVQLARRRLVQNPLRVESGEDVALSAMKSFCKAAAQGRFPQLHDDVGLWRLLCSITRQKAIDAVRRSQAAKRQAVVLDEGQFDGAGGGRALENVADPAATVIDEWRRLFQLLDDAELETIALAKLDGFTNPEIAAQLGCGVRTVERRLSLIRMTWNREFQAATG